MKISSHESNLQASKSVCQSTEIPAETPFLRMLFFGSIVAAPYILAGMSITFSAIALPQMQVNLSEASWFGSLHSFGSLFGSVAMGLMIDKYGRRPSLIFSLVSTVIGWTLIAVNYSITLSFIGQFLSGIVAGTVFIGIVYAAESIVVNHHHLRNSFSTWMMIAVSFGTLLNFVLGRILPYQQVAIVAAGLALVLLVAICIFIPESPRWLFEQGEIRRAKVSEKRLSIHQPLLKGVEYDRVVEFGLEETWQTLKSIWQKLKRKDVYKPVVIITMWNIFGVFSGGTCISAYMINILEDYPVTSTVTFNQIIGDEKELNGYDLSIVSGVLSLIAVILTSALVAHLGTKKLYSIASFGLAVGMAGLGISLSLSAEYQEIQFWRATHIFSVWLSIFCYMLGVSTIPTTVSGEMFPADATGFVCLGAIIYSLTEGVLLKLHFYFYTYFGGTLYFMYAAVSLWNIIFVGIFVQETVGKTQEEIGQHFLE